jgi:hypothetical protein
MDTVEAVVVILLRLFLSILSLYQVVEAFRWRIV